MPVRLLRFLPGTGLERGQVGMICSVWCYPTLAYEVEFACGSGGHPVRMLLLAEEIAAMDCLASSQ